MPRALPEATFILNMVPKCKFGTELESKQCNRIDHSVVFLCRLLCCFLVELTALISHLTTALAWLWHRPVMSLYSSWHCQQGTGHRCDYNCKSDLVRWSWELVPSVVYKKSALHVNIKCCHRPNFSAVASSSVTLSADIQLCCSLPEFTWHLKRRTCLLLASPSTPSPSLDPQ